MLLEFVKLSSTFLAFVTVPCIPYAAHKNTHLKFAFKKVYLILLLLYFSSVIRISGDIIFTELVLNDYLRCQ